MSLFDDVGDFNRKFELPVCGAVPPGQLRPDLLSFRMKFMYEELTEFMECAISNNLAGAADALVDLVYVALGTAHFMGLPFDEHWKAVQEANMKKVRAESAKDPLSKRGHAFDVVKPPGWTPPDHLPILDRAMRAWAEQREKEMYKPPTHE